MRLLFAARRLCHPLFTGGAELSWHELANALAEAGHNVMVLGEANPYSVRALSNGPKRSHLIVNNTKWDDGQITSKSVLVTQLTERHVSKMTTLANFEEFTQEQIEEFAPNVVFTQLDGAPEIIAVAKQYGIPVIHGIRDTFNPVNFFPYSKPNDFISLPDITIANSNYCAEQCSILTGITPHVVYPIVSPAPTSQKNEASATNSVLFVNPVSYKGGDIMFEVATNLHNVHFRIAPGWGRPVPKKWQALENVDIAKYALTRQQLFSNVSLAVVPTQGPEAFGRVGIEAQVFGIPVTASNHSGLAESLGSSAHLVDNYTSSDSWCEAIISMLSKNEYRNRLTTLGFENTKRYSPESAVRVTEKILNFIL
jgi:glycosyltransferase involved in cell wall biosynthesis